MGTLIDLHCDTILEAYLKQERLRDRDGHINLEKMRHSGGMAQCFAIFATKGKAMERRGVKMGPYELFQQVYAYYQKELEANSDLILPAYCTEDVKRNEEQGKLSAILTLEDCMLLEGKLERVEELASKGVRMAALVWNYENSLAYPNHMMPEKHLLGLKPFGIEVVNRMNEIGIIVDVSHLSEGGFYDVAKHSSKPFAASHSCAGARCRHPRNLTDDQLRCIGEHGGVVGINFYSNFLTEEGRLTENQRIVEHVVHVADKAGIEAVAFGSDFDGIDCELEMKDYDGFPVLIEALRRHFSDDEIDRICSSNFLRVFHDCEG